MLIREFLCLVEHQGMLFHLKYPPEDVSSDIIVRSSLISALYSFAAQVENDTLDSLKMEKETLLFKKSEGLIFVLFLDSSVNPDWFKVELDFIQLQFFKRYPEKEWLKDRLLNLSIFDTFKPFVNERLLFLNRKVSFIMLLIDEGLISEEDYQEKEMRALASIVAKKLMIKLQDQILALKLHEKDILNLVDKMVDYVEGTHIERTEGVYTLTCNICSICNNMSECFFEEFLDIILTHLGYETHVTRDGEGKISIAYSS